MKAYALCALLVLTSAGVPVAGGGTPPAQHAPLVLSLALQQDPSQDANALLKQAYETKSAGKRADALTLFEKLLQDYPNTSAGAEAAWMVAYYRLNDRRFEEAERLFQQVSNHLLAPTDIQAEALLQTGFVYISRYWASADRSGAERWKLLEEGKTRLLQIAQKLSTRKDEVGRTAAGYALLGVGEAYLYQGLPEQAEVAYRKILAEPEGIHPVVLAQGWYALGVSLYRQRKYGQALEAFEQVKKIGEVGEGIVLRSLALGNALPERAWMWQAAIWSRLGDAERSLSALEQSLSRPQRLAGSRNAVLLTQAQKWLEGMRRVVARSKEREQKLAELRRVASQIEQHLPANVSPSQSSR